MKTGRETSEIIAKEKYAPLHPLATGMPYLSHQKLKYIGEEMSRIFLITVLCSIIVMFLVTRSLRNYFSADYHVRWRHHDIWLGGLSRTLHGRDQHHGACHLGVCRFHCV